MFYPDVSQMYLTCSVTFQENTCILTFCMIVFHTHPKRVQDTFWDTHQIHQDTCILGASLVSHWILRIRVSWTLNQDTSGYTEIQNHDTCILDGIHVHPGYNLKRIPRIYPVRYVTEMQDTCEIHLRYIRDTCICRGDQDTCGIHLKYIMRYMYMYLKCIQALTFFL
jgi:hypothetical protein